MPVEITGFSETPNVGDELGEMENERAAKKLGEERQEELRKQRLAQPRKARMEAVSYTQLDVYKRQPPGSVWRRKGCSPLPSGSILPAMTAWRNWSEAP